MTKKNQKKQFCPHIYAEWGELFDCLTDKQKAEILIGITKFPQYEPVDVPIWNFIKSQLQKDYELFVEKCEKNGEISRNYWANKNKSNDIQESSEDTERIPNDIERHPKHKRITETNNELPKQITKTLTTDPYFNPLKETFKREYKRIFNKDVFLGKQDLLKLSELADSYSDIESLIPIALNRLKNIDFKDIKFKPTANWLLKDNNFERVMNGEFEQFKDEEAVKADKKKLLEMARSI